MGEFGHHLSQLEKIKYVDLDDWQHTQLYLPLLGNPFRRFVKEKGVKVNEHTFEEELRMEGIESNSIISEIEEIKEDQMLNAEEKQYT